MKMRIAATAALLVASLAGTADAGYVIDVTQVGSNVVATASGSIDLTGLTFDSTGPSGSVVGPADGTLAFGTLMATTDQYTGASGPPSFGSGASNVASSGTGDFVGVVLGGRDILVPTGYVSGQSLSGSATWDGTTFAGLGITPGTYTYTWGSGPDADSLTINVGVPEPSSLVLVGTAALAGVGLWSRRRRRR